MIINFKKIIIHNFLSYGHAELDLTDKHYCLVKGENRGLMDNATSNGAGKSSWSSAICWALTGETIQGLSTNIKNIHIEENLCYVELIFSVDKDNFKICRYKNPKSDLKIELNGEDVSGKGIRESEDILSRYLPDLTSQLIASIIILGQGLPNKFTANTPSGRKEVLEKLSKSDFMINDLKARIANRQQELNASLREAEDLILSSTAKCTVLNSSISRLNSILEELQKPQTYDVQIFNLEHKLSDLNLYVKDKELTLNKFKENFNNSSILLANELKAQDAKLSEENVEFEAFKSEFLTRSAECRSKVTALDDYICKIMNIKDTCPTCGQALPNVNKPDASAEIAQANKLKDELVKLEATYASATKSHNAIIADIKAEHSNNISKITFDTNTLKAQIAELEAEIKKHNADILSAQIELSQVQKDKSELSNKIESTTKELSICMTELNELNAIIAAQTEVKDVTNQRLHVISQMNTLIKRDFRGYLLSEIIEFIAQKSKEYCLDIFKTDRIEFALDGNNINISYAGKSFENLSGGEKQRIDLIIQFAIRNMMEQYLNFSSNILVLDEIFDQLDSVGCESVLELITSKLIDVESIFIISHRADELEIPCDYEITVIKDEQGVSTIRCL